jgi:MFS family permease
LDGKKRRESQELMFVIFYSQTGACILSLGYANIAIIPCANIFGRRPTALVCCAICIGSHIWQALSTSYSSFLGGRVLVGIGAATSESLMPVVISDMMFLHERGTWMGAYL